MWSPVPAIKVFWHGGWSGRLLLIANAAYVGWWAAGWIREESPAEVVIVVLAYFAALIVGCTASWRRSRALLREIRERNREIRELDRVVRELEEYQMDQTRPTLRKDEN